MMGRGASRGIVRAATCAMALASTALHAQAPARRGGAPPAPVVVDGDFSDWEGIAPAAVLHGAPAADAFVVPREVRIRHDAGSVFFLLDLGREVVPQGMHSTVEIVLDADGNAATGAAVQGIAGADVAIVLSPPIRDKSGAVTTYGSGVLRFGAGTAPGGADGELLPTDTAGLMLAPSTASTRVEVRIARGTTVGGGALFRGGAIRGKVVAMDSTGARIEETDVFRYALTPAADRPKPVGQGDVDPLARAPGTAFRLLSWNVNGEGLRQHPEPFRRALAALRPDVVMLDEVTADSRPTVDSLLAAIPAAPGEGSWNVLFGAAGGRQRGVIASRRPVALARAMARVPYPDSLAAVLRDAPAVASDVEPAEGVPTLAGYVTVDGRRVLLATVDLKCCGGGQGTAEDRIRRIEARAMADAVRRAVAADHPHAVVIAGDYNLVGTAQPLQTLRDSTDVDGSSLFVADAPRLDGLSYATWGRPRSRFAPGRLDFHLYGDETLRPARSFAFDAADLSPRWLAAHALRADDSVAASGHRPVVTDFAWAGPGR